MALPKDEVAHGMVAELESFHALISELDAGEWARPSRCQGWSVGDVGAHLTGFFADIAAGRLDGVGTQAWYDRQVAERRGQSPAVVAKELAEVIGPMRERATTVYLPAWDSPAPPAIGGTLGAVVLSMWCGIYLHIEDILAAVGRPPRRGPGLRAAVWFIAAEWERRDWGSASLVLEGLEEIPICGGGNPVTGDPLTFVLAASGRADPAAAGLDPRVNIYG